MSVSCHVKFHWHCRIEETVRNMTSLAPFERLKAKISGGYCDAYCSYGFPIEILLFLQKCFDTCDNFTNPAFQPDADQWLEVMNC